MADLIKRQWLLITIILVTVTVNGALISLTMMTAEKVEKAEEDLAGQRKIVTETIDFQRKKYGLTKENKANAQENKRLAWESYDKDYAKLTEKYGVATYDSKYADTPFAAKSFIENRCESMAQDLESRNVELSDNVKTFTFNDVIGVSDLPPKENVEFIIRNMLIVDDIVKILYQSELKAVTQFTRTELKRKDHEEIFKYIPFTVAVQGNYGSIRKFINNLNDPEIAGYLYVIRDIKLTASDIVSTAGAAAGGADKKGAAEDGAADKPDSKSARIAFKDMALVTATVDFDYIELIKKEPN